jgi:hypothetical protein
MTERIRTLLLEANGTHWVAVSVDTALRGWLGVKSELPASQSRHRWLRKLFGRRYEEASYLDDWKDAFCQCPQLQVDICNITDLVGFRRTLRNITDYALVVVLHSAAGDRMSLLLREAETFRRRHGALAVFIGNEYDLLAEKIRFIKESAADYICSQLPFDTATWLYDDCVESAVLAVPHGLNPDVYIPQATEPRRTDVGFVGDLYERLIGDCERTDIVRFFERNGAEFDLQCDIRYERLRRADWVKFLNRCHGAIGAESGTRFLDRDGAILSGAKNFLRRHPDAPYEEVFDRCFKDAKGYKSGKAISSRHFEPIGTKTCQILIEGRYNDILKPNEHYISVKADLSDIGEAVRRFKDVAFRQAIVETAYEYVRAEHTYAHRVRQLLATIGAGNTVASNLINAAGTIRKVSDPDTVTMGAPRS